MSKELSTEKTMTVQEVAKTMGKDSSTIRKIGKSIFPNKFENGKKTNLNEKEVTAIKLNLGKNSELPKTELEKELIIKQAMFFQNEKIINLQEKVNELKPKADLADKAIRDETTQYSIRDAGKHIGLKQTKIFSIMRDKKLLTTKNIPTQKAIDMNILSTRTNVIDGKNYKQAVMTMENIHEFNKRYNKS